jgi:hypothetical protein
LDRSLGWKRCNWMVRITSLIVLQPTRLVLNSVYLLLNEASAPARTWRDVFSSSCNGRYLQNY